MSTVFQDAYGSVTPVPLGTNFVTLDGLAVAAIAWSDPIANASPAAPRVLVHYRIKMNASAPAANGTIQFLLARYDGTIRDHSDIGTMTATGSTTTAAAVIRAVANLQLLKSEVVDATAAAVYEGSFIIEDPGTSWQLLIYNGTSQAFNATSSPHLVEYQTITPTGT